MQYESCGRGLLLGRRRFAGDYAHGREVGGGVWISVCLVLEWNKIIVYNNKHIHQEFTRYWLMTILNGQHK